MAFPKAPEPMDAYTWDYLKAAIDTQKAAMGIPQKYAQTASMKPYKEKIDLLAMLMSRLRYNPLQQLPFDFIHVHELTPEKVVIFLCHNQQALVMEDDANLYPSDAFITKLKLLMG